MTFFKVNDPKNRKLIEDVIAKRAVIREADRRRKMGDALEYEQLSRFFKPITQQVEKTEKKIEKGVKGIPGEIARILPRPINLTRNVYQETQPPPAYEAPFAEEEEIPEAEEDMKLPEEVKEIGNGEYQIGDLNFNVDEKNKKILIGNVKYSDSSKIYNILTNKKNKITWNDLNENEKKDFGKLIINSNVLYKNYEDGTYNQFNNTVKWKNLYAPIWYNRFIYMDKERLKSDIEKNHMKKSLRYSKIKEKLLPETKDLIMEILKKGEGLKGSGLKKNYVTLPSEPSELVDRLTLLSGSKDAGNTGVYNEMVSICDELLKRKIIGKGQYKQFLSNI